MGQILHSLSSPLPAILSSAHIHMLIDPVWLKESFVLAPVPFCLPLWGLWGHFPAYKQVIPWTEQRLSQIFKQLDGILLLEAMERFGGSACHLMICHNYF